MCVGLLPALSIAAGVGQAVVGYQAAQADYRANEELYKTNLRNATQAANDRYEQINSRIMQEDAAASQEIQEAQIAGLQARSSAAVASAEGGVSGVSVDAIVRDQLSKEARFVSATKKNLDYSREYWRGEQKATQAQAQGQVNSVKRVARPSFLPFAMQAFGSSIQALG